MKKIISIVIMTFILNVSFSQDVQIGHYILDTEHKPDTLIDNNNFTKFILDTSRVNITAIDNKGRLLWQTDPWKDKKLEEYRVSRPIIVYFVFANNERTNNEEVIWIVYNNTQFGTIDKKTGKFTFRGQD